MGTRLTNGGLTTNPLLIPNEHEQNTALINLFGDILGERTEHHPKGVSVCSVFGLEMIVSNNEAEA